RARSAPHSESKAAWARPPPPPEYRVVLAADACRPQTEPAVTRGGTRGHRASRPRRPRRAPRRSLERAPCRAGLAPALRLTVLQGPRDAVASCPLGVRPRRRQPRADRPGHPPPRRILPPAPGDPAPGAGRRGPCELQGRGR